MDGVRDFCDGDYIHCLKEDPGAEHGIVIVHSY